MSEIGRVIDHIAADALGDPLKAAGFRMSGRTWRRQVGDAVQVIHVQASRYNAAVEGELVLSAGVYFPALATRLALFPPSEAPGEPDCHVRTRPMPPGKHWWKVRAAAASLELADHAAARRHYAEAVAAAGPAKADELRR